MKFYTFEILVEKEPNDEPHMYLVDKSVQSSLRLDSLPRVLVTRLKDAEPDATQHSRLSF